MSDLPKSVRINEEGPREGFQIEKGPISTARKIALIDSLSETGLKQIQCVSFVNPKNVPGWADAQAVTAGFKKRERVSYTCLWLNDKGFERAEMLARHFGPRVLAMPWEDRIGQSAGASAIVNTTTLGMKGAGDPGIVFDGLDPRTVVCDIVYVPLETAFLAAASRAGLRTVDGLGMLLHQAVPGFEKWFGVRPEVTEELRAVVVADIVSTA